MSDKAGTVLALGIMMAAMAGVWFLNRKQKITKQNEFDEMQLKIRARGYQIGFYTALALLAVLLLLTETGALTAVTTGFAVFAVIMVSVTVFAVYCILNGAFLGVRDNGRSNIAIFSVIVLLEGFNAARNIIRGGMLENGRLGFSAGAPALMFLGFLAVLVSLIVKVVQNRKEASE